MLRRGELYLLLATIVLTAVAAVVFLTEPLSSKQAKPRPSLELRVADQNGRMRVDWDANRSDIQTAQGATLEVEDGGVLNRYPVEPNVLRSGGLDYVRRSDDVLLTLTLYHDGHPGVQSSVRRIAPVALQLANRETPPAPKAPEKRSRGQDAANRESMLRCLSRGLSKCKLGFSRPFTLQGGQASRSRGSEAFEGSAGFELKKQLISSAISPQPRKQAMASRKTS